MSNSSKKKEPIKEEKITATAEPSKVVPKFVTKIGILRVNDTNVLNLFFQTPEESYLVERVALDNKLTGELIKLLQRTQESDDE